MFFFSILKFEWIWKNKTGYQEITYRTGRIYTGAGFTLLHGKFPLGTQNGFEVDDLIIKCQLVFCNASFKRTVVPFEKRNVHIIQTLYQTVLFLKRRALIRLVQRSNGTLS